VNSLCTDEVKSGATKSARAIYDDDTDCWLNSLKTLKIYRRGRQIIRIFEAKSGFSHRPKRIPLHFPSISFQLTGQFIKLFRDCLVVSL
jgi:hypothetical protein